MFFSGIVTITTSPAWGACSTVTGVAPVSAAKSASVSGPLEFATKTLCPSLVKRRVSVPPMLPAPIIPIFISVFLFNFVSGQVFDLQVRWRLPPLRVREIFRYPKRDNLPVTLHCRRSALQSAGAGENEVFDSSEVLPLQFFHFCGTWEIGWPFCWDRKLRSADRSCGLLEELGSDGELYFIKDEKLGGNEPDCETNHQGTERK